MYISRSGEPGNEAKRIDRERCTSFVPRLSWNANMYHWESLVSFLRKHDVIKIGLKQKGNVLHVVQPTMRSMLGVYDI